MVTLDQVLLLERKVENAVQKIEQLKAENDALRSKCAELTNALSVKTEQFSSFESDQNKIEAGILSALSKLSEIENSIVDISETNSDAGQEAPVAGDAGTDIPPSEENTAAESQNQTAEQPAVQAQESLPSNSGEQTQLQPEENASGQNDLFSDSQEASSEELGGQFEKISAGEALSENAPEQQGDAINTNPFDIF